MEGEVLSSYFGKSTIHHMGASTSMSITSWFQWVMQKKRSYYSGKVENESEYIRSWGGIGMNMIKIHYMHKWSFQNNKNVMIYKIGAAGTCNPSTGEKDIVEFLDLTG